MWAALPRTYLRINVTHLAKMQRGTLIAILNNRTTLQSCRGTQEHQLDMAFCTREQGVGSHRAGQGLARQAEGVGAARLRRGEAQRVLGHVGEAAAHDRQLLGRRHVLRRIQALHRLARVHVAHQRREAVCGDDAELRAAAVARLGGGTAAHAASDWSPHTLPASTASWALGKNCHLHLCCLTDTGAYCGLARVSWHPCMHVCTQNRAARSPRAGALRTAPSCNSAIMGSRRQVSLPYGSTSTKSGLRPRLQLPPPSLLRRLARAGTQRCAQARSGCSGPRNATAFPHTVQRGPAVTLLWCSMLTEAPGSAVTSLQEISLLDSYQAVLKMCTICQ